jgi:hypothetical protein
MPFVKMCAQFYFSDALTLDIIACGVFDIGTYRSRLAYTHAVPPFSTKKEQTLQANGASNVVQNFPYNLPNLKSIHKNSQSNVFNCILTLGDIS